ncbi:hypothetical protein QQ045_023756 [Rhodiola kirilowii]
MDDDKKMWIQALMEIKISSLPVKYLGVALNSKGIKAIIEEVNSLCAKFLWKGSLSGRACHLASWPTVCKPKREGGLGIKDLKIMNECLVLSQLWDIEKRKRNKWMEWLEEYWPKGRHWWDPNIKDGTSWVLKRISKCRELSWKLGLQTSRVKY